MCLVAVKIYGINPIRFLRARNQNIVTINKVIPCVKVQFSRFLNSLRNVPRSRLIDDRARVFVVQKFIGISSIGRINLN